MLSTVSTCHPLYPTTAHCPCPPISAIIPSTILLLQETAKVRSRAYAIQRLIRTSALVILSDTENSSSTTRQMDILDVLDASQPDCLSDTDYLALLFYPLGNSEILYVLFERTRSP